MKTQARTITLSELKSRCSFYGYSAKKEYGEFRAYPKGKPELDCFDTEAWPLYLTVQANALHAFKTQLESSPEISALEPETREEVKSALLSWYASNGAKWKENLWHAWLSGRYDGHSASGTLQRIRNYHKDLIQSLS